MAHWLNKRTVSWSMYDWANSAYSTIVNTTFFPILFSGYWYRHDNSTTPLGLADGLSSLVIVLLAPILGAIADRGGLKKGFLLAFLLLGAVFVGSLAFVDKGHWQWAISIYVVSYIGFLGANIFYDSLIVDVSPRDKLDMLSALGFSLGYLGGGLALLGCVIYADPHKFGITSITAPAHIPMVFLFVAIWWVVFALPLLFFSKEKSLQQTVTITQAITRGFHDLLQTIRDVRQYKNIVTFLVAYWLYIDGVDTIILMAADYGKRIGFADGDLIMAFLLTQFIAFPAALLYGKFGERYGAKTAILTAIAIYIGVTCYGYFIDSVRDFYILAIIVGLVMGGIQSLSRSLYAQLIPVERSAEFFGFYNMLGKLAAVLGPWLMAIISHLTGSPRLSILSLIILFISGGWMLLRVNVAKGE